jgi:hypothetical protein
MTLGARGVQQPVLRARRPGDRLGDLRSVLDDGPGLDRERLR